MAYYDFMVEPFAICIEAGYTKIDEVFPDDLKQKVTIFLANKGLGPDGKPLPKEPEEPVEDVKDEPKEPVEEVEEEEPSKDTKEEDKSPVEEDKGAK